MRRIVVISVFLFRAFIPVFGQGVPERVSSLVAEHAVRIYGNRDSLSVGTPLPLHPARDAERLRLRIIDVREEVYRCPVDEFPRWDSLNVVYVSEVNRYIACRRVLGKDGSGLWEVPLHAGGRDRTALVGQQKDSLYVLRIQ